MQKAPSQPRPLEENVDDDDILPLSSAFPYDVSTPATTTSSILLRRLTSLGTAAALLYLLHPIPQLSSFVIKANLSQAYVSFVHALDVLLSTLLILGVVFGSFHLALYEGTVSVHEGKELELKWLMMGVTGTVALVSAVKDETWIKINLLWNLAGIVIVFGWLAMNKEERKRTGLWIAGLGIGRVAWEVWGK